MLPQIEIHPSAESDLDTIFSESESSAALLLSTIEQIDTDENLKEIMLNHKARHDCKEAQKWLDQYNNFGRDLWRLKVWESEYSKLLPYRIIYAYTGYMQNSPRLTILAVVKRKEFNYERDTEISSRIISDYKDID